MDIDRNEDGSPIDPYSACLSQIDYALREAKIYQDQMNEKEYQNLQAIQMECDAVDGDFDWVRL